MKPTTRSRQKRAFGMLETAVTAVAISVLAGASVATYQGLVVDVAEDKGFQFAIELRNKAYVMGVLGDDVEEILGTYGPDGQPGGGDDTGLLAEIPAQSVGQLSVNPDTGEDLILISDSNGTVTLTFHADGSISEDYTLVDGDPIRGSSADSTVEEEASCDMPHINHALVLFGADSGPTLASAFQTYGNTGANGLRGMAVDGAAQFNSRQSTTVTGASVVTGTLSGSVSRINWNGGLSQSSFPYVQSEWQEWAESVSTSDRVFFLDNVGKDVRLSSVTGMERPSNASRLIFIAPGDGTVTIERNRYSRQLGDILVAPSAHVHVTGGSGNVDGLIVAESLSHSGQNTQGDVLHGGIAADVEFTCA